MATPNQNADTPVDVDRPPGIGLDADTFLNETAVAVLALQAVVLKDRLDALERLSAQADLIGLLLRRVALLEAGLAQTVANFEAIDVILTQLKTPPGPGPDVAAG
jgi:hypothetical protein